VRYLRVVRMNFLMLQLVWCSIQWLTALSCRQEPSAMASPGVGLGPGKSEGQPLGSDPRIAAEITTLTTDVGDGVAW
jgi:hypothetical protein